MKHIDNIFHDICSQSFDEINRGINQLNLLINLNEVEYLHRAIVQIEVTMPKSIFIEFLRKKINALAKFKSVKSYLVILKDYFEDHSNQITKDSKEILKKFILNKEVSASIKTFCLKGIWHDCSDDSKVFIVELIHESVLFQSSNLLIDALDSKNSDLLVKSINTLSILKVSKSLPYLRKRIHSYESISLDVLKSTLIIFGTFGGFFETVVLKKFLSHKDFEVKFLALRSYRKIRGKRSIDDLYKLYQNESDIAFKNKIIKELALTKATKAGNYILDIFDRETNNDICDTCFWQFFELDEFKRKKILINRFDQISMAKRLRLLKHFVDFSDPKILVLLQKCVEKYNYDLFTINVFDVFSNFDYSQINMFVKKFVDTLNSKQSFYAVQCLLRAKKSNVIENINELLDQQIELSEDVVYLFLDSIFKYSELTENVSSRILSFIENCFRYDNKRIKISLIRSLRRFNDLRLRELFFNYTFDLSDTEIFEEFLKTAGRFINNFPQSFDYFKESKVKLYLILNKLKLQKEAFLYLLQTNLLSDKELVNIILQNRLLFREILESDDLRNLKTILLRLIKINFIFSEIEQAFLIDHYKKWDNEEDRKISLFLLSTQSHQSKDIQDFIIENLIKFKDQESINMLNNYLRLY